MKNKLMVTGSAIALIATFSAHQALAGDGNEAFVTQDGISNSAEIDQAGASFARVGNVNLPFVQQGDLNRLTIDQVDATPGAGGGPRVTTFNAPAGLAEDALGNGFQFGNLNVLSIDQTRTQPGRSGATQQNEVGLLFQIGEGNIGFIDQVALTTFNKANLRQVGGGNIANIEQSAEVDFNRSGNVFALGAGGTDSRSGGALQRGNGNVMNVNQINDIRGQNLIREATQDGTTNLMNIFQSGSNTGLDFGVSGGSHNFAADLGLEEYTSRQQGILNFLDLSMTGTGVPTGGVLFATQQTGEANSATISLSGNLSEFALLQNGFENSVVGIGNGDNNDMAVRQIGDLAVAFFSVVGNGNEMLIDQSGMSNDAGVQITGDFNTASATQIGVDNFALLNIDGNTNTSTLLSDGNSNSITGTVTGNNNDSSVTQMGNDNTAAFVQIGNLNSVSIMQ